jgi:hypothetical protein
MADPTQVERLGEGVETWNGWRRANPSVRPDLSCGDLSEIDLRGINLGDADLTDVELFQADLSSANLKMAVLRRADLSGAKLGGAALYKADLSKAYLIEADLAGADLSSAVLQGADLRGVILHGADLTGADLRKADLNMADLTEVNLTGADVTGADLRSANLEASNVTGLNSGGFSEMKGRYYGIRGLSSCYGNPLFVRDARDQDYLDSLEVAIDQTPSNFGRRWKRFWFGAWSLIDYGRSLGKLALGASLVMLAFGAILQLDVALSWGLFDFPRSAESPLTPYYFSVITFTRLGSRGIVPLSWVGEVILVVERLLGYVTLGLLLSIFVNKVARRS